jgi:hypothetical protein
MMANTAATPAAMNMINLSSASVRVERKSPLFVGPIVGDTLGARLGVRLEEIRTDGSAVTVEDGVGVVASSVGVAPCPLGNELNDSEVLLPSEIS